MNDPNMNQGDGGIYNFPSQAQVQANQYNYAQPKTIYDDIKANPNYVPPILNPNPNYPSTNNNNIYPPPQNNFGYNSEGSNIYSGIGIPQSNPGLNSQNSGNIYSATDNRPAYIPQYAPNNDFMPKPSGDIPIQIQNNPSYIPQISGNINPSFVPQSSGDINPGFAPQISGEINTGTIPQIPVDNKIEVAPPTSLEVNTGVTPQISGNINPEVPPPTLDNMISPTGNNNIPTKIEATSSSSTEPMPSISDPLLAASNQEKISGCGCCSNCIDSSIEPLDSCFSKMIIIFSIVIAVFSAINSLIALTLDLNEFNAYLYLDISIIVYSIINCFSVVRIRWLRVLATFLTVVFLIIGTGGTLFQYIVISTEKYVSHTTFNFMKFLFFMRLIFFALTTHIIFYGFWGINCCKNLGSGSSSGSSYRTHRTHFNTHHIGGRSHFGGGHHSHPHFGGGHHSRPHFGGGHHHGGHHGGHGRRH